MSVVSIELIDYLFEILSSTPEPLYYVRNSDMIPHPGSTIDTNSKFTFNLNRASTQEHRESWVPVELPPSVPQSVVSKGFSFSDWSSYKGSSVIVERTHEPSMDLSRFSPSTTTTFSPKPTPTAFRALPSPPRGRLNSLETRARSAAFHLSTTPQPESDHSAIIEHGRTF